MNPRRGIHTPDDLRLRCTVLETGCWLWAGGVSATGRPTFWLPALRARVTVGQAACWWATGRRPAKGESWHCTCTTRNCANPAHRVCGTRSSQMLAAKLEPTLQHRLHISAGRRRLTDEAVREIAAWRGSLAEIAARHRISVSYACALRNGRARQLALAPDVRVTVCPSPWQQQAPAPSIFGALRMGSYLPGDSAVARAYGARGDGRA